MQLQKIVPMFWVDDVRQTIDYYVSVLGFDEANYSAEPEWGATESSAVRFRPDHWLVVDGGRIVAVQRKGPDGSFTRHDQAGSLVLPGFVDSHVHSGQIDVIASYGTALLDWLTTHTFPAEARHRDRDHAERAAAHFVDALLAHGTTTAVVFPTVHAQSSST